MNPNDFNNMSKDKLCDITDVEGFKEFVLINSIQEVSNKLFGFLFKGNDESLEIVTRYITEETIYTPHLQKYIEQTFNKYTTSGEEVSDEAVYLIKRGDIDKVIIEVSNFFLYRLLSRMTDDKILKFCWDNKNETFIWLYRTKKDKDPVETIYPSKIKKTKRAKKDNKSK